MNASTSLQHIVVTHHPNPDGMDRIQDLFRPKPYPLFSLVSFYNNSLYDSEQFRFFIDILE